MSTSLRITGTPHFSVLLTMGIFALKVLLAHSANVNALSETSYTSINWTAYNGHAEATKVLLALGSDIDSTDRDGHKPLHWAAHLGHPNAINELIDEGATTTLLTHNGWTSLVTAQPSKFSLLSECQSASYRDTFTRRCIARPSKGTPKPYKR